MSNAKALVHPIRILLAKFVYVIHMLCILILVFGFVLPKPFLPFLLVFIPATIIQWMFNTNQCVLTQLQYKLEGREIAPNEEGTFIRELFRRFSFEPTPQLMVWIIYGVMAINWSLSAYRLFIG